ncbi:MAG: class I SAM-dependent methyltransferase [Gordonia sp. (in: high G+C Gram-positive bacteria)]|uniref:methyltransferase domain-containing protein n=1 Tax=Gordonia sp. (in: high G+C Gram-positive bacteria) TaxID=84139 RepID=UPI0039E568F4
MDTDLYTANAEWYGALSAPWQEATEAAVGELLGEIPGGIAVDLGAGTGTCLPLLDGSGAERLVAVEPSRSMRAGLVATLAAHPGLLNRTTVVPDAWPAALRRLPDRWSAAVMLNAVGHLTDDARLRLWETLAERLVPGGRFVVALQPPERATSIPWTDFGTVPIGDDRVHSRGRAEPLDEHTVEWTMEWTLTDADGHVVERRTSAHSWRALGVEELSDEATAHGLTRVGAVGSCVGFVRPGA